MRIHVSDRPLQNNTRLVNSTSESSTVAQKDIGIFPHGSLPPSALNARAHGNSSLEEKLFDNRASIKVLTSRVSMHLRKSIREDIFRQIDDLLDPTAWDDDSSLIHESSFMTFLRFLLSEPKLRRPALSVSLDGNIMASWMSTTGRMTIEFLGGDLLRLVAHHPSERAILESIAFEGSLKSVESVLSPIGAVGLYREAA